MGDRTYHLIAESPEDARYENYQAFFFFFFFLLLFNLCAILTRVCHEFVCPLSQNIQAVLNMLHLALFQKACWEENLVAEHCWEESDCQWKFA